MQEQDHLVVLFADVSDSTRLYETLGNDTAQGLIAHCLSALGVVVERYRGQVVKTIGDELMCIFPNAVEAARAAGDMQSGVREAQSGEEGLASGKIRLKVGLHYGQVLVETGDVFGETVNMAARMAKLAKPDQIITTEPTVWKLPEGLRATTRFVDEHVFEGRLERMDIYEVLWEVGDVTDMATHEPPASLRPRHTTLTVVAGERQIVLDELHPQLTIGRSETNELVVPNPLASRQHARIQYQRGRFILHDQSVNGTFIERPESDAVNLLRDDFPLCGIGRIGLGQLPSEQLDLAIRYVCE